MTDDMTDYNIATFDALTIAQLYEDEGVLRYVMHTIGVNPVRNRNKIVDDGFNSIRAIVQHHANDVNGFQSYLNTLNKTFASAGTEALRVYYSPVIISRFCGVLHYYNQAVHSFHSIPDPSFVDVNMADELASLYNTFKEKSKRTDEEVDMEVPVLTGSSNWVTFRDKFLMKLALTTGKRGFSLEYVLDETTRPVTSARSALLEVDTIDLHESENFTTKATHFGRSYKSDNSQVWLLLKSLLLGTPVYNHISSFDSTQNGRRAWHALKEFYEGQDFRARLKDQAFNKLLTTFYKGDSQRFTFEKYVAVHKEAHKLLEDSGYNNGAGMDESTKCHHFIANIKEQAGLEHALSSVRANPQYQTFIQLTSFLTAEVDHRNIRRKQLKTSERTVSGVNKQRQQKQKTNKNNSFNSKVVEGKTVYGKQYPRHEFNKLSHAQRDAVIHLRREARKSNSNNPKTDKTVSGITMEDMVSLGDAIVAGVTQAQNADLSETEEETRTTSSISTKGTKRRAPSGGVGSFISLRKKGGKK